MHNKNSFFQYDTSYFQCNFLKYSNFMWSIKTNKSDTAQKMKFSIKDFFRKWNQIRRKCCRLISSSHYSFLNRKLESLQDWLHKKWSFALWISLVNVTKSAVNVTKSLIFKNTFFYRTPLVAASVTLLGILAANIPFLSPLETLKSF